jgi:hypothetical protein
MSRPITVQYRRWGLAVALGALVVTAAGAAPAPAGEERHNAASASRTPAGLTIVAQVPLPGIEPEIAGIHPHPTRDGLFLVAANAHPAYPAGQASRLPERYRGKLLTVDGKTGDVVRAVALTGGDYGGIAVVGRTVYVSSLDPPELLQVDPDRGVIQRRIAISGPAGGLASDATGGTLLAQLYTGVPHIAVVDVRSGRTIRMLWSDENAMDLAMVGGDLLCTWASSFDGQAFGDLRRIDPATGRVTGRIPLDAVHTSMAPMAVRDRAPDGFVAMVRTGADGSVALRTYRYDGAAAQW